MPSPLDILKDPVKLARMQSQAKKMKKEMAREKFEFEDGEFQLVINGDRQVEEIIIDGVNQKRLVKLLNKSLKQVEIKAAQKMFSSGGMDSLLGGLK